LRTKLYVLSLIPNALISGWCMFFVARVLGQPLLVAPRPPEFVFQMIGVAAVTFTVLNLLAVVLFRVTLVRRGNRILLIERGELPSRITNEPLRDRSGSNKPLQPTRAAEPNGQREPERSGPRG